MFCISFVAIINMLGSMFVSDIADKDALAINHSGSIRMQSYKVLANVQLKQFLQQQQNNYEHHLLEADLAELDKKLNAQVLVLSSSISDKSTINKALEKIKNRWSLELQPQIQNLMTKPVSTSDILILKKQMDTFVLEVNALVSLYQQNAEDRILLIRAIQGISLFVTVILVVIIMFQLNRRVEKPLSELTHSAKEIITGNYSAKTHILQNDELGFLSKTMNQMADAIAESQSQLENRVKAKTAQLRQNQNSLELLYETSTRLSNPSDQMNLEPIIDKLSKLSGLVGMELCLMTIEGKSPYEHIATSSEPLNTQCIDGDCASCISDKITCESDFIKSNKLTIRYPLVKDNMNFGVLKCKLPVGGVLEAWQHRLLQSITSQIATSLKLIHQSEQNRRYALVNERTVIARELHDSLAQSLSYLKIQVTRLQKLQQKNATEEQVNSVVTELKSGLNSAYRQLRELLTTFRLKIDAEGLKSAFEQSIHQLNERADGKIKFELDYRIADLPLSPNEEIHIMQIAREATQNALNHSHAHSVNVSVFSDENKKINLHISDDGIGIPDAPEKLNHYGLEIMRERARQLDATIEITENKPSGTIVKLSYIPTYIKTGISARNIENAIGQRA